MRADLAGGLNAAPCVALPPPTPLEISGAAHLSSNIPSALRVSPRMPVLHVGDQSSTGLEIRDGLLKVTGTQGNDRISVFRDATTGKRMLRMGMAGSEWSFELELTGVNRIEIHGLGGDDVINLRGFNLDSVTGEYSGGCDLPALLCGGEGNDIIFGGNAADRIFGGQGHDWLSGGAGDDLIAGQQGDDHVAAGAGDDTVFGNEGWDRLNGDAGSDSLFGGDGQDLLDGGAGSDVLFGGDGDDAILGGAGADWIYGGKGKDHLTGGDDRDSFWGGDGQDLIGDLEMREEFWLQGPNDSPTRLVSTLRGDRNIVAEARDDNLTNLDHSPVELSWNWQESTVSRR